MSDLDITVFIPGARDITRCRCGASVFFAVHATNGRMISLDVKPSAAGTFAAYPPVGKARPVAEWISAAKAGGMRAAGIPIYLPHLEACPKADEIRREARQKARRR